MHHSIDVKIVELYYLNNKNVLDLFKAVKHLMLNTKESPCEKSPDYNFAHCVENKLAAEVGCKPYWIDIISLNLPVCANGSQYAREAFTKCPTFWLRE